MPHTGREARRDIMPTQITDPETESIGGPGPAADPEGRAARAFQLAAAVLADLQRHGIPPTPRAYELWSAYRRGVIPELTRRLSELLEQGAPVTPAALDALYSACVAGAEPDLDALGIGADAIQVEAQAVVEQVNSGRAAIRDYGEALTRGAAQLGQDQTQAGLVCAITMLTAETTRAAERNRVLEQQLAASSARIGKLRKSLADVKQEATTDALTGLCNRRAFDARIRRMMAQAKEADAAALSLLLLDVDHFKRFNDVHGHSTGDLVLRLVARLPADNVKGRDTVARYGGEEFAILLTGAGLRAAEVVARQINEALSSKRLVTKGTAASFDHVTISGGVAQARPGEAAAALVERADAALYEAKRTGRNRVCVEAPAKAGNTTAAVASARGWARLPGAAATLGSDGAPNRPCTNELPSGRNAQHVCATPNACDDGEVG